MVLDLAFARTSFELGRVKNDLVCRLENNLYVFFVVSFFHSLVCGNLAFKCELVRPSKSCGEMVFCCVDLFVCAWTISTSAVEPEQMVKIQVLVRRYYGSRIQFQVGDHPGKSSLCYELCTRLNSFWPLSEAVDCNKYVFIASGCAIEWSYQIYMENVERRACLEGL
jgi:hypothetical protein